MSRVVICDINLEMYEKYSHVKRGASLFISFMNVQIDYTGFLCGCRADIIVHVSICDVVWCGGVAKW